MKAFSGDTGVRRDLYLMVARSSDTRMTQVLTITTKPKWGLSVTVVPITRKRLPNRL